MAFQWLQMRIGEEKERRQREAELLARLPRAVDEVKKSLGACVDAYAGAFGADAARLQRDAGRITITAPDGQVEVAAVPELPGFEIRRDGAARRIQIGVLPGDRLFYLDLAADQYLTMEELTRLILDRVLFPKLKE